LTKTDSLFWLERLDNTALHHFIFGNMLKITEITGPLITAEITEGSADKPLLLETVYVGNNRLLGEIISVEGNSCKVQVYEDTVGIAIGEPVELRSELLSVELGPGLMSNIFDGIQRPLERLDEVSPVFIGGGIHLSSLDQDKKWDFVPTVQVGDTVRVGDKVGYVDETSMIRHWVMVPPATTGDNQQTFMVESIESGSFTVVDVVGVLKAEDGSVTELKMAHKWPVKIARPIIEKMKAKKLFQTGQRVIDGMFPIMLGARVSTPGPFGAGKTFTQQQVAKWSNAQIVVYVGCGERGNEMTEMVKLFPTLKDPRTGKPLMDRTVLIANTSNMPIAAREASIYTGITIAEYFRDMGYDVVLMADSTSRWAEAMREISQRLGEMPSEEGFPAYLSSRIAAFYERAGVAKVMGSEEEGSVTVIGTVSPPGGDFSEPITQTSLKNSLVFLALDAALAAQRHYPSINWNTSFTLYGDQYEELVPKTFENGDKYISARTKAKQILAKETELLDLVKLVGMDGLDNGDRLTIEIAKSLREDFLQQNGFDETDTYCSFDKMVAMMLTIAGLYEAVEAAIDRNPEDENLVADIFDAETKNMLSNMKYRTSAQDVYSDLDSLVKKVQSLKG